jgi:hypothetical protein
MKKIYLKSFVFLCILLGANNLSAGTAEIVFLYNLNDPNTPAVDIEIINKSNNNTVVVKKLNVAYLHAVDIKDIPSSSILKINVYTAGTSSIFSTYDNQILNDNQFSTMVLYGTFSSRHLNTSTAYYSASSNSLVKYKFLHSAPNLGEIDLRIKESSEILSDNFKYADETFGFDNEFTAASNTLEITSFSNNSNILDAYEFNGLDYAGKYVYLFAVGNSTDVDMYAMLMNGTVTKLKKLVVGINLKSNMYRLWYSLTQHLMLQIFPCQMVS